MTVETRDDERAGACWECGYSLRGLTSRRCPECGRPFDPADETSMNMGLDVGAVPRWLMKPPGWPLHLLSGAAVIMSLWAAAAPSGPGVFVNALTSSTWEDDLRDALEHVEDLGDPFGRFLIGAALWVLIATVWTFRRVARGVAVKRTSGRDAAPRAYWRRWLAIPIVFGVTVVLCLTPLPVIAGFWISKSGLEQVANEAPAKFPYPTAGRWIGIYPGASARVDAGGTAVSVVQHNVGGFFARCAPGHEPEENLSSYSLAGPWRVRHLYGPWYLVTWKKW